MSDEPRMESLDGSTHMVIPASQAREQAHECLAVAEDGSASTGERSCSARAAIAYAILELASAIRETAYPTPDKASVSRPTPTEGSAR